MSINGSGLTFDPDHSTITRLFDYRHKLSIQPRPSYPSSMATPVNSPPHPTQPPATIQFPVSLGCPPDHDHDDHGKRKVIDEMDFFADKKETSGACEGADDGSPTVHFNGPDRSVMDFKVNTGLRLLTTANTGSDESIVDDGVSSNSEDKKSKNEIAFLQVEMERINSENRRLREMLNQVTNNQWSAPANNYNGLQMHVLTLMQQQQQQQQQQQADQQRLEATEGHKNSHDNGLLVPRQFMDLGFAANSEEVSMSPSEGRAGKLSPTSPDKDVEERDEQCPESKVAKHSHCSRSVDQATEATMRKARVSVRARSDAPMITDGCQWRKYGQNYRCTLAMRILPLHPRTETIQRCADDTTILITTYEGNHNHPLPPAAMAMASTTSSAVRMLLSGSMPSADGLMNSNFLARTLLPCSSSMATISASAPFPTITLDLTQSPNPLQFPRHPNQFPMPFLNTQPNAAGNPAVAALLPQIFGQALYNQSKFSGLQMSSQDILNQSAHQVSSQVPSMNQQMGQLNETVNALATDPSFTAALAAAISSLIGGLNTNNNGSNNNAAATSNNIGRNNSS
ncbi:hypothetical protein OROMI_019794 [Orobanche minor]